MRQLKTTKHSKIELSKLKIKLFKIKKKEDKK